MSTISQLIHRGCKKVGTKSKSSALDYNFDSLKKVETEVSSPQRRGICVAARTVTLKKPNSALRKVARACLSNGYEIMAYIPGIRHSLQKRNVALIRGGYVKDPPGACCHTVRGTLDTTDAEERRRNRSEYGTKKPKA